jgi:hypothetical protein
VFNRGQVRVWSREPSQVVSEVRGGANWDSESSEMGIQGDVRARPGEGNCELRERV